MIAVNEKTISWWGKVPYRVPQSRSPDGFFRLIPIPRVYDSFRICGSPVERMVRNENGTIKRKTTCTRDPDLGSLKRHLPIPNSQITEINVAK